ENSLEVAAKVRDVSAERLSDTDLATEQELLENRTLEVVEIDGVEYIGYITIPSQDLIMAVTSDPNDEWLRFAACRYYGSPYTNDMVICGHNYDSGFGKIKELAAGDEVIFTDMNGNVTEYTVELTEVLKGTDVSKMVESGYDLTLYTCTFGGSNRFTVRCTQVPL
ncbi:MAG: sortase, partial [Clostridiales bacterium]|nr:sortase [Clostridiales bacterium]